MPAVDELLYECGLAYLRVRADKRPTGLRAIDSLEAALADLEYRARKFLTWAEKYEDKTLTPEEVRELEEGWADRLWALGRRGERGGADAVRSAVARLEAGAVRGDVPAPAVRPAA